MTAARRIGWDAQHSHASGARTSTTRLSYQGPGIRPLFTRSQTSGLRQCVLAGPEHTHARRVLHLSKGQRNDGINYRRSTSSDVF